jgi:hypothetical protein
VGLVRDLGRRARDLGRHRSSGRSRASGCCAGAAPTSPASWTPAAPGILVAQAIGRIGNYFNQELFGKPTTLPWGLEISPAHRPVGYLQYATFNPTFLYELIFDLALAGLLIWLGRRGKIRHPGLFALYVAGYSGFRIFEESIRIDPSHRYFGLRLNFYVATLLCLAGLDVVLADPARRRVAGREPPRRRCAPADSAARAAEPARKVKPRPSAVAAGLSAGAGAGARARLRIAASSAQGRVLATSAAVSQPRRAVATP